MSKNTIITLTASIIFTSTIYADISEAKELFNEAKCLQCHSTTDFKARKDKVNSFKKLHQTVDKCVYNNNTGWFDDETTDVVRYLNQDFYHFKDSEKDK